MEPETGAAYGQMAGGLLGTLAGASGEEERQRLLELLSQIDVETGDVAPEERRDMTAAIDYLQQLYSEGGLDSQARAALAEAQQSNAAQERMARGAIGQNAAMRGVGGSGVEIAAQLANQQGAANRNAASGTRAAADARTRAIQALLGSADIAGTVRGQDSTLAQFNAAQRLRKASAQADALSGVASAQDAAGTQTRQDYGNMGGFLGTALSGLSSKKPGEDDEPVLLNQPYD